jgi:hypothetical protein
MCVMLKPETVMHAESRQRMHAREEAIQVHG